MNDIKINITIINLLTKVTKHRFTFLIFISLWMVSLVSSHAASITGLKSSYLITTPIQGFNVNPANGTFIKQKGVSYTGGMSASYNPGLAGIGIDSLIYEKGGNRDTFVVHVKPVVQFDADKELCEHHMPFTINEGTPAGPGTFYYQGSGVTGVDQFNPAMAGTGIHEIVYFYEENGVTHSDTSYFTVKNTPSAYNLSGSGIYCEGSSGKAVSLSNSETGVSYQLKKDGGDFGAPVNGHNGNSLTWNDNLEGTYTVLATDITTGCTMSMNGAALITEAGLPEKFGIVGDAMYCAGGSGVTLKLDDSETDVSYQLLKNNVNEGSPKSGDGDTLKWNHLTDGKYKIKAINDSSGCIAMMDDSLVVKEMPLPTAFDFSGGTDYCKGGSGVTLELDDSESGINYYLYKDGNPQLKAGTGSPLTWNNKQKGDYYVRAVNPSTGCARNMTGNVTVSENDLPVADAGSHTAICYGDSTVLNASGGVSYQWSPGISLKDSTEANTMAFPEQTQTYTVTVTDNNGCQSTDDVTINIKSLPNVNAGPDKSLCKEDTIILTATGGDSYEWSTSETSQSIEISPGTNSSYYVTATHTNGCINTDTVMVTVKNKPTANAGSDTTICTGTSALLKASGGNSYQWSNGDNNQNITVAPNSTTNYKVTVTNLQGCQDMDEVQVEVVENPSINTSGDEVICFGDTVTLSASALGGKTPYDFSWNTGEGTPDIDVAPTAIEMETDYKVIVTDDNFCKDSAIVGVFVNKLPEVEIEALDDIYCKDHGPVAFHGNPTSSNGIFTPDSVLSGNPGNGHAEFDPSGVHPGTIYSIYYEYTDGNGCVNSDTFRVEVSNDLTPNPSIHNLQSMYCDDDPGPYTITGDPIPGAGENASFNAGALPGLTDNGDGTATLIPSAFSIGTYHITYSFTNASGCEESVTESFDIGIPVTLNINPSYCESESAFTLTANKPASIPDGHFKVYKGTSLIYEADEGTPQAVFDPSSQKSGSYSVKYEVDDGGMGCSNSDSVGFVVHGLPDASFTLNGTPHSTIDIAFCNNQDTVTLKGANGGGTYYGTGVIGNKFVPKDVTPGNYKINYEITGSQGCTNTDSTTVKVKALPVISIDTLKPAYCNNVDSFTILGNPSHGVWSDPWGVDSIFRDNGDGTALFTPTYVPNEDDFTISYKVTGANSCADSVTQVVSINFIPYVDFAGLPGNGIYCKNGDTLVLNGTPQTSDGTFSGPGIKNLGNGLASFDPSGLSAGDYNITYSYQHPVTGCTNEKTKTLTILNNPKQFALSPDATICEGDSAEIKLMDSENGIQYELIRNDAAIVKTMPGGGSELSFGYLKQDGTYKVKAFNASCGVLLHDSVHLTVNETPLKYQVLGDTAYCIGESGISVELSGSQTGVNYILKKNGNNEDTIPGTGGSLSWKNRNQGIYRIVAENAVNGCKTSMNGHLKVSEYDTPDAYAGKDTSLCRGYPVQLNASGGVVYSWNTSQGLSDSAIADPYASPEHSKTYVVTVKDENHCVDKDTVVVDVFPNPTANAGGDTSLCRGEAITLTAQGGASYKWSTGQTTEDITVAPLTSKSYQVTVSGNNHCKDWDTVEVEVKSPPVANAGSNDTICRGETTSLKATGGGNYQWNTGATTANVSVSPDVTTTYRVTVTNDNHCSDIDSVKVVVMDNPQINIGHYSVCRGEEIMLTPAVSGGNGNYDYEWNTGSNHAGITVSPASDEKYYVTVTDAYHCQDNDSTTVTVKDLPTVNLSGLNPAYCNDTGHVTINGTPINGYYSDPWGDIKVFEDEGNGEARFNPSEISVEDNYTIWYTAVGANGCKDSISQTITIHAVPDVTFSGLPDEVCPYDKDYVLTGNPASSFGEFIGGGISDHDNGTAAFNAKGLASGKNDIIYTYKEPSSGCHNADTQTVTIYHLPGVSYALLGGGEYCEDSPGNIIGLSGSDDWARYALYLNQSNRLKDTIISNGGNSFDFNGHYKEGTYSVKAISGNNCVANIDDTITISRAYLPGDAKSISGETKLDLDSEAEYSIQPVAHVNDGNYHWNLPPMASIISGSGTHSVKVSFDGVPAGDYTLSVHGENACGAGKKAELAVSIKDIPGPAGPISGLTDVCQKQENIKYRIPALPDADSINWSVPEGFMIISGRADTMLTVNIGNKAVSGYIIACGVNNSGVGMADSLYVTVHHIPDLAMETPEKIDCSGDPVALIGSSSTPGAHLKWKIGNGHFINNDTALVNETGEYEFIVTASGCQNTGKISVYENIQKPDLFVGTPDTITCGDSLVTLSAVTNVKKPDFSWEAFNGGEIKTGANAASAIVRKSGKYKVRLTNQDNACYHDTTIWVYENKSKPVIDVSNPQKIKCSRNSVRLHTTPLNNVTYDWDGPGIQSPDHLNTIEVNQPGQYTLMAENTVNNCQSTTNVMVDSNYSKPSNVKASVSGDLSCHNSMVRLIGSSNTSNARYAWDALNDGLVMNAGEDTAFASVADNYVLTVTHPLTGCFHKDTVQVAENMNLPEVNITADNNRIGCSQSIQLTATSNITNPEFYWSTGEGHIVSGRLSDEITIDSAGTYKVRVTDSANGCYNEASITIEADYNAPAVSIVQNDPVITCDQQSVLLQASASGYASLDWKGPGKIDNPNTLSPTVYESGKYVLTATADNGCQSIAVITVGMDTVKPNLILVSDYPDITCQNLSDTLKAQSTTPNVQYSWEVVSGTGSVQHPSSPEPVVSQAGIYQVKVTASNGCYKTGTVEIDTNYTKPVISSFNQTPDSITCKNSWVTLNGATSTPNAIVEWSTSGMGQISNKHSISPKVNAPGMYELSVKHTVTGCEVEKSVEVFTNYELPEARVSKSPDLFTCTHQTIQLDGSMSSGTNFQWEASDGGHISSDADLASPFVDAPGWYHLTVEHPVSGCKDSDSVEVVADNSVPAIIPGFPKHHELSCDVQKIDLPIDSVSSPIYWWSTGDSSLSIEADQPGKYTFHARHPVSSCSNKYTFTVKENKSKPEVRIEEPDDLTCFKQEEKLHVFAERVHDRNKVSYVWSPGTGGHIKSGHLSSNPVITSPAEYYLKTTDDVNGCSSYDTVYVGENRQQPAININDDPATLTCSKSMVYLEENSGQSNVSYQWTTSGGGNIYNATTPTPGVDQEGYYTLTLKDLENGCSVKDSVYVKADFERPDIHIDTLNLARLTCKQHQVELKGSAPGLNDDKVYYHWQGPGEMSSPQASETYVNEKGNYLLKVTLKRNGCDTTARVFVEEDKTRPAPPVIEDNASCYGAAINALTTGSGHNVNWYSDIELDSSQLVSSGASFTPNVKDPGKYEYYATRTSPSNGCESKPSSAIYTVNELPSLPGVSGQSICHGQENPELQALPGKGNTIQWYDEQKDSLLSVGPHYIPQNTLPGSWLYNVTQEDSNGCESGYAQVIFTINQLPEKPDLSEKDLSICHNSSIPSFSAKGDEIRWYSELPVNEPVYEGNLFKPSVSHIDTHRFYVTNTHEGTGCESSPSEVSLTIKPNPSVYEILGGGTYCEGTGGKEVRLKGSDDSGENTQYKLLLNQNTTVTVKSGTGNSISFGNQTNEGIYTVKAVAANGCESGMKGSAYITRNPLPEKPGGVTGLEKVCQGLEFVSYEIDALENAETYHWNIPEGFTILTGEASRVVSLSVTDSAKNGIISVYGENHCGDGISSEGVQVTVKPKPGKAGNITGPASICQGDKNLIYEVPPIEHANYYVWHLPSGFKIKAGEGTRKIIVDANKNTSGGKITVYGRNDCNHGEESEEYWVTVNKAPRINKSIEQSVCASQTTLQADDPGNASIEWSVIQGPAGIEDHSAFETTISGLGKGENQLGIYLEQQGCHSYDTVTITNNQRYVDAGEDLTICGEDVALEATAPPTGATGFWSIEKGTASFEEGGSHKTTAANFAEGENHLTWTIINKGCESSDDIVIRNDQPTRSLAGIDQNICKEETELKGNIPYTGQGRWSILSGSAEFDDYSDPATTISNVQKGTNVLKWTIRNKSCISSDTVRIHNNRVVVHGGEDQIICSAVTTLSASIPEHGKGSWSLIKGSALFVNRFNPKTEVSGLIADTNHLRWTVNRKNCISHDDVIIYNDAPSDADAGDPQVIEEDHTYMTAEKPDKGTGEWTLLSGSADIVNPNLHNTEVTSLNRGDNVFQWKVAHNHCISIDTVTITNNTPTIISAGEDQVICGTQTVLDATKTKLGIGEWSVIKGSAKFEDNRDHNTRVYNLGYGENILRWSVIENGTTHDDVSIVNNMPSTPVAGADQAFCQDYTLLSANQPAIGKGTWEVIGGAADFKDSSMAQTEVYNLGFGTNTLRWTIKHKGCVKSDDIVLTNNLPTPANAGEDKTICADHAVLNGNNPEIGEGIWTIASGASSATFKEATHGNTEVTDLGKGANTLRWTITHENCISYDEVVIINDLPTDAYAGADQSICTDTLTLAANNPVVGIGEWSILSGSANFENIRQAETKIENISYGNNILRWTITHNGCVSYDEVEISYDLIEAEAGLDQKLCEDNTVLQANNPGKGEGYWSVVAGSGSAVFKNPKEANTEVSNLEKGKNILRWSISYKNCVSHDDVLIENNLPSEPFAGPDQIICDNKSKLEANSPLIGTGKWSLLSGSAVISDENSPVIEVSELSRGPNTFRWTIKNKECVLSDEVTISNNLPVMAKAGEDKVVCEDSTRLYGNEPPFGKGQWTVVAGAASFEDVNDYNTKVYGLGRGANTLRWTISNKQCQISDEVIITNDKANTAIAGPDQIICANETEVNANTPGQHQGYWEIVSGSAEFDEKHSHATRVKSLSYGTNTLRWVIEHHSCRSVDEITITNNLPSPPNAGVNIHVCGDEAKLFAEQPEIGEGAWSLVSGNAEFDDDSTHNTTVRELGFGANTLRWTNTHEGCVLHDEILAYNDLAYVHAGEDQTVYEPQATLVGNRPGRGEGQWVLLGGSGTFEQASSNESVVSDLGTGINTFRWTIDNNGCIASDEVTVTYYEMPRVKIGIDNTAGCPPLTVNLVNNSVAGNAKFTWDFGDGNTSINEKPKYTYYHAGQYSIKLKTTGPDGSTVYDDTTVVVYDLPVADFDLAPEEVFIPEQILHCYDLSVNAEEYLWEFGNDSVSKMRNPTHKYTSEGIYDICLHVWSEKGCHDSLMLKEAVKVEESGKMIFPDAFTPSTEGPNGGLYPENDYENNVFHPLVDGVEEYHLEIFNRWGILVFESHDADIGWDGYYQGELVEEDVYIWRVYGKYNNGRKFEKAGDVLLIRK